MSTFCMPSLGADMEQGRVVEWLVEVGQEVVRGQPVVVVETDKGAIEVESWSAGLLERILVAEGEVTVGTPIAEIRAAEEVTPAQTVPRRGSPAVEPKAAVLVPSVVAAADLAAAGIARTTETRRASPRARSLARTLGVDVETLQGSGPQGAVTSADVERAASGTTPVKVSHQLPDRQAAQIARPRQEGGNAAMRRAIGRLMIRSKREIPHYYLATTIDMHHALQWLERYNADQPIEHRILPAAQLLKASALAVAAAPQLNGFYSEAGFTCSDAVHLGVAVALRGGGLVAPAIHHADRLTLADLMRALRELVQRARSGRLRRAEMADATLTVTSLGDRGVEAVQGVIYPPQVALVGFGAIVERPWIVDGAVVARRVVSATLAADHRVSDGHRGGLYLAALARELEHPEGLDRAQSTPTQTNPDGAEDDDGTATERDCGAGGPARRTL